LFPALDRDREDAREEVERLREADVPDPARDDFALELVRREPGADLPLERNAPDRRVLTAHDLDPRDGRRDRGRERREGVHEESRIDACAEEPPAVLACEQVELLRELRVPEPGPTELLAGADDGRAAREEIAEERRAEVELRERRHDGGVDRAP